MNVDPEALSATGPLYDTMTMTMSEHACKVSRFTLTALIDQVI